jgi:hypothetical protein
MGFLAREEGNVSLIKVVVTLPYMAFFTAKFFTAKRILFMVHLEKVPITRNNKVSIIIILLIYLNPIFLVFE